MPAEPPPTSVLRRLPPDQASGLRTGFRHRLRQVYRRPDLVVLGLGVMIGAGIFNVAGRQAASTAGPGVILSFIIAGVACLLAALCYAELSSTLPSSGSAYTFTYVIFGEIWAWVIGWALVLELVLAAAVVARVWSLYAVQTLTDFGVTIAAPYSGFVGQESGIDLFTLFILGLLALVVAQGARLGQRALWVMVVMKLIAIGVVIFVGARYVDPSNYTPLVPAHKPASSGGDSLLQVLIGAPGSFGWFGIFAASTAIAFAYIGFDIVATASEETEDAPRSVPAGMVGSLVLVIFIYLAVAFVMIGMVPYDRLDPKTPLTTAFRSVGEGFMARVIDVGALLGLTTVILVVMVGATRVVFSMARDGLLPRGLATLSKNYRTPSRATLVIGLIAIVVAESVPVLTLEQMVVIGTLFAFLFVAIGAIVMRVSMPELPRGFRIPFMPLIPMLSIVFTLWLMINLSVQTWVYFGMWMAVGLLVYAIYGMRYSALAPRGFEAQLPYGGSPGDTGPHRLGQSGQHQAGEGRRQPYVGKRRARR